MRSVLGQTDKLVLGFCGTLLTVIGGMTIYRINKLEDKMDSLQSTVARIEGSLASCDGHCKKGHPPFIIDPDTELALKGGKK